MKIKGLLWCILIVALLFVIVLIFYLHNKNKEPDKPVVTKEDIKDIKSLHYTYSVGYAIYSNHSYDLKCDDKCTIKIKPNGFPDEAAKTYDISEEEIKRIIAILNKYEVSKWDGFNKSDPNVLDGNDFSFSLHTKDDKTISASGYMMWPDNYRNVKGELEEVFNSHIKDGDFDQNKSLDY